jgi:isopenicillin N synthase-like dioxygenase
MTDRSAPPPPTTTTTVPIIDLSVWDKDEPESVSLVVQQVAEACSTIGFFQVIHHGIPDELIKDFRSQCRDYFTKLPTDIKNTYRRTSMNARGFFDDELTKQRLDWKQALDVGIPGSRNWDIDDNDVRNTCLDGFNQFPSSTELPGFRDTVIQYFQACERVSDKLAQIMQQGIVLDNSRPDDHSTKDDIHNGHNRATEEYDIVTDLKENHTSYLRMNYYPVYSKEKDQEEKKTETPPLGISPHKDAGFLTVLLQDEDCYSLQVWMDHTNQWETVVPIQGAVTINTGDMAQIWSNGRYKAPLHRVLTHTQKERFSAPFFYNPGYNSVIRPFGGSITNNNPKIEDLHYHPCLWGYFRAVRFAGDFTDLGVEIQIEDYKVGSTTTTTTTDSDESNANESSSSSSRPSLEEHPTLHRQRLFHENVKVDEPFHVEDFRTMLLLDKE